MKAAGKTALESVKEAAVDVAASALAASARSGLEKTKAVIQEKEEKTSAHTSAQREAARDHKAERVVTSEPNKELAIEKNAVKRAAKAAHISTTGGVGSLHPNSGSVVNGPGYTLGPPRMSAVPPQATRDATGGD